MKGQLEELGEETDENVENISKMQGQILNMTKGKVNIFDGAGNFKSTYEIMKGIAEVWDDLSSIDQADLLETIAGKHRANDVAALLSNWKNVEAAVKSASEAEGSAARENAKYIDSIQGRLDRLTTVWQSFANTFMSSDFLKGAVSGLTTVVEIIEKIVKTLGTVGTIGLGVGVFNLFKGGGLKTFFKAFSAYAPLISTFDTLGGKIKGVGLAIGDAGKLAGKSMSAFSKLGLGIGAAAAIIGTAISLYKKYREEMSRARQETIQASDEFLDASDSFEQVYIKYSGKTGLTSDEEAELASAIQGTVDALGDKSSALQSIVNGSNDYLASLESIKDAELEEADRQAKAKRDAAELELEEAAMGYERWDGSEVDISLNDDNAIRIAKDMDSGFLAEYEHLTDGFGTLEIKEIALSKNADTSEIIDYYNFLIDYQEKLSDADMIDTSEYKDISSAIEKMSESVKVYTDGVYEAAKAQYQLNEGIPKTTNEYLEMRKAILENEEVEGLSVDTKKSIANTLDSEYGQIFDLSTNDVQARKLIGVLDEYGDAEANQIETFLNMRTKVNNNECTVGDYISQFDDINKMTEDWEDGSKEELNTTFGLDTDAVKKQYDNIYKHLSKLDISALNEYEFSPEFRLEKDKVKDQEIRDFLDDLSTSELAAVVNLKTELDWETDSWDDILKQIEKEAALIEAISFSVDIELETEKLTNLTTAISESVSGAGLSIESISLVEDMFGNLDGYDKSALFERTANGIRLNNDELRKLNDEYRQTNVDGLDGKIDALGEKYFQTRKELSELTYGTDEYSQKARELSDIEAQIKAAETLAAQYEGLASAYQTWQRTESAGSQRDMYESIISGFETVGDEISRGWMDDGTIEFLRLLRGETATIIDGKGEAKEIDIATASAEQLKQVWKDLDKNIKNTSYSVRDFFTVDEDGNSTSKGVYNFLDAIGQLEEEKFGGENVVDRKDGKIVGFNFDLVGGDEVIAEALGISEELVQIMQRAADDAGFVVTLDGSYQQLDVLKEKAQEAAESLNKTLEKSGKKGFDFNFNATKVDDIKKQLTEANKILDGFRNKDGTINMEMEGADKALTVTSTLQSMLDKLTRPAYMDIEVSKVEDDLQEPLRQLQELQTLTETEHQLKISGSDTSKLEESKQEIYNYFERLDPEVKAKLGLVDDKGNPLTGDSLKKKIESGDVTIEATVDIQMKMDEKLGILVDKALLDAGIIDDEEFNKRVKVYLEGDVDSSDVDEKVDNAVENENSKPSVVKKDFEIVAEVADGSNVGEKVDEAIKNEEETPSVVRKDIEIEPIIVEDSDVDNEVDETIKNGNGKKSVVEKDVEIVADVVDGSNVGEKVDETIDDEKGEPSVVKKDVEIVAGVVDGSKINKEVEESVKTDEGKSSVVKKDVEIDIVPKIDGLSSLSSIIGEHTEKEQEVIIKYLADTSQYDNFEAEDKEAVVKFIADTLDVDGYTAPEKEAYAKYIADGGNLDAYTAPEKEAIAKYLVDGGDVNSYSPADKDAIVKFLKNTVDIDNYTPAQKQAIAKFIKDSIDVDNYQMPTNKMAYAKYLKDTHDIDIWTPPLKTGGIAEYTPSIIDTVPPTLYGGTAWYKALVEGDSPVNGTANVNGTAFANGTAFKQGNWGTKGSGVALMGELGTETIVRDGRFFTVGDDGAGFYRYKKGDIIFNHKQTEELFKNGKVTSDGGRARAYVSGTAFSKGTGGGIEPEVNVVTGASYGKSSSDDKSKDEFEETIDWIETAIDRIERAIDQLDTKANSVYRSWSERNTNLVNQIGKVQDEIELQQSAYDKYMAAASATGLSSDWISKIQNGKIDIETITDETLAEKIKDYQNWYEKALDCKDAILELKETESELYAQRFQNIQTQYDGILQGYEHTEAMLNEYISQAEEQGYIVSKKYYDALISNEKQNIAELKKEQAALIAERDEAVASGTITKNSEAWIDMCNEIDSVTQAIEEGSTAILEYARAMEEIDWEIFDLIQERISGVAEEADFLIELMSNKKLFDDDGKLTSQGLATMALHSQNYNTHMYQADEYGAEVARLNKQIAEDPYDQELINRRNEVLELQRESILAAEDEKNAIRDMVEEGINLELDALQERIDKYNEALDSQKDLYDYQKKVKEQVEEIASLEKQMGAYQGDISEEAQARIQEIKVELENAKEDLAETEYERLIGDTEALLDTLYNEYELILNQRLDNVDYLLEQVITSINSVAGVDGVITSALGSEGAISVAIGNNATSIKSTLETESKNVGATLSSAMNNIWSVGEGNAKSVLTMYGEDFRTKSTTIITTLNGIKSSVNSMVSSLNKEANKKTNANKTSTSAKKNPTKNTSTSKKTTTTKKSSGDGTPKIGDRVKYVSGQYYYDSQGKKPLGSHNQGKYVYITNINKKDWATHGYHISTGNKLGKGDLGWLKLNQLSGYASGKKNLLNDEVAWTQEQGREFIVRPSDGAILTPVAKGDSVLNAAASGNIWNMANSPVEFIKENLKLDAASVPNNSNVQTNYTQHLDKVVFNFPNVKNYDEMLSSMQKDKNFERLVTSMTVDKLAGKSSLAKGKSIRH